MAIDRQGISSPVGHVANYKGLVYLSGQMPNNCCQLTQELIQEILNTVL